MTTPTNEQLADHRAMMERHDRLDRADARRRAIAVNRAAGKRITGKGGRLQSFSAFRAGRIAVTGPNWQGRLSIWIDEYRVATFLLPIYGSRYYAGEWDGNYPPPADGWSDADRDIIFGMRSQYLAAGYRRFS